ncbi:hypothetical protein SprV_0501980700 [Sparganum proliferum]
MAAGDRSSPVRCLFTDVAHSPNVSNKISRELQEFSLGEVRRFQQRYDFDLLAMQPLGSTPSLSGARTGRSTGEDSMTTADATPRGVHLRWSWEPLDPTQQYVPRFYRRMTYPVSLVSSRNSSVENIPPTPVKPGERGTRSREGEKTLASGCDCVESPKMSSSRSRQTSVLAYFPRILSMSASQQVSSSAASSSSGEVESHRCAFHARALSDVIGQAIFLRSRPLICDTYIPGWLDQLPLNRIFIDPVQMVRQLHDGMMARVTDNGAVSEAFTMTNGVKQGCVLAPTLFSLMFSVMLMDAYRDEGPLGIRIAYRTDGHLLNQRRMHFQSRASTTTVCYDPAWYLKHVGAYAYSTLVSDTNAAEKENATGHENLY